MTPGIPITENPLPDGFYDWDKEEQEEYIQEMDMQDILKIVAFHTEEEMELFQSQPTEPQMRQVIKQWLNIGVAD